MPDVFSPSKRSQVMALIRSGDTKPELAIRQVLHRLGYRYRLHDKGLPGRPDLVLPRYRTVVQVRGCFWHGHTCHDGHLPKSRHEYWVPKLAGNVRRDRRNDRALRRMGWNVVGVWECQCMSKGKLAVQVKRILRQLGATGAS
jgi:DNA mismatch endonuclease, patch repair protein